MKFSRVISLLGASAGLFGSSNASPFSGMFKRHGSEEIIAPKFVIISMFTPEAVVWWGIKEFNLLEKNITVPGLSPLFPEIHCTGNGEVCQIVVGEAEINAAASIMALALSPKFDLTETYWMVAGIAGVNPEVATLASVAFARYSIQFGLSYEIDAREKPDDWPTGYSVAFGTRAPSEYPTTIYGTEIFELNADLRSIAAGFASSATLNDSATAIAYRSNFSAYGEYAAGAAPPSVVECDVTCSDVWFTGNILSSFANNLTNLYTNGTGKYCMTAEEDNATLESLIRAAKAGLVDFSRIIVMRTASDFDRQYPGQTAVDNLLFTDQGAFLPSVANLYIAGIKVVEGILEGWESVFKAGVKPSNYIGDAFGTLGAAPPFGPGVISPELPAKLKKRELSRRGQMGRGMF